MATKNFKNIVLPPKYVPKKTEPYMCPEHLAYFYQLLTARREQLAHDHNDILNDVRIADNAEPIRSEDDIQVWNGPPECFIDNDLRSGHS